MQTAFIESIVNLRHTVLGISMHDLCLYDAISLTVAGNPLWVGGTARMEDLQQAALICNLPPGRFLSGTLDPRTWPERLSRMLWKKRNRRRAFHTHLALWDAYVADFNAIPEYWTCEDGKSFKAPWLYSMACFIEQNSNMVEREILTAPIGKMFWKAATIAERLGISAAELITEEELQIGMEQIAAIAAERERINTERAAAGLPPLPTDPPPEKAEPETES